MRQNINENVLKKHINKRNKNNKRNVTIYVVRLGRSNALLGNSAPCVNCTHLINRTNIIKRIVYSNEYGEIVSVKPKDYNTNYLTNGDRNKKNMQ